MKLLVISRLFTKYCLVVNFTILNINICVKKQHSKCDLLLLDQLSLPTILIFIQTRYVVQLVLNKCKTSINKQIQHD